MATKQIICMNGGVGETSYANNSSQQRRVLSEVMPLLEESLKSLYCTITPNCWKVGDLGCSSGPNALLVVSEIMDIIGAAKFCSLNSDHEAPISFQIFLNDLPENDFNVIFNSLSSFYTKQLDNPKDNKRSEFGRCFINGSPGSFYGRLFPDNSMHFFHSCYSIHWRSQVPEELAGEVAPVINKGNIYAAKTSPPAVHKAYLEQFQKDFKIFLRSRSEELVPGGAMVLTFLGRLADPEFKTFWEITGMALHDMVLENLIEEEKLDSFNIPVYCPTAKEVEQVIEAEGSFTLTRMECFNMDWYAGMYKSDNEDSAKHFNEQNKGKFVADHVRAVLEPLLKPHFGEAIMDDLFLRFATKVVHLVDGENLKLANLTMSMTKNIGC